MTTITYVDKKFRADSLALIDHANDILADYQAQGLDVTLRQLYYQFVSRDLLANSDKNYKKLGGVLSDARLAGLVSWTSMVDRTREVRGDLSGYRITHERLIRSAAERYIEDLWDDQPCRIEVWVEKEALAGVIERARGGLRCAYFSCRGYTSQTAMWDAGQRMSGYLDEGKQPIILHLGDHDPSGIDMTRDIQDRLNLFVGEGEVEVRRIALNMEQIEQYQPPPNPAKITDSRAMDYIARYGRQSWELDALEPSVLIDLIRSHIHREMDSDLWDAAVEHEQAERAKVVAIADRWEDITAYLEEHPS